MWGLTEEGRAGVCVPNTQDGSKGKAARPFPCFRTPSSQPLTTNGPAALVSKTFPEVPEEKKMKHVSGVSGQGAPAKPEGLLLLLRDTGPQVPPFLLRRQAVLGGSDKASGFPSHDGCCQEGCEWEQNQSGGIPAGGLPKPRPLK